MSLPGFSAETSICNPRLQYRMATNQIRTTGSVHPAGCKCDWWVWGFDPAGCAIRELTCDAGGVPPISGPVAGNGGGESDKSPAGNGGYVPYDPVCQWACVFNCAGGIPVLSGVWHDCIDKCREQCAIAYA